jgi:hypothetical protein
MVKEQVESTVSAEGDEHEHSSPTTLVEMDLGSDHRHVMEYFNEPNHLEEHHDFPHAESHGVIDESDDEEAEVLMEKKMAVKDFLFSFLLLLFLASLPIFTLILFTTTAIYPNSIAVYSLLFLAAYVILIWVSRRSRWYLRIHSVGESHEGSEGGGGGEEEYDDLPISIGVIRPERMHEVVVQLLWHVLLWMSVAFMFAAFSVTGVSDPNEIVTSALFFLSLACVIVFHLVLRLHSLFLVEGPLLSLLIVRLSVMFDVTLVSITFVVCACLLAVGSCVACLIGSRERQEISTWIHASSTFSLALQFGYLRMYSSPWLTAHYPYPLYAMTIIFVVLLFTSTLMPSSFSMFISFVFLIFLSVGYFDRHTATGGDFIFSYYLLFLMTFGIGLAFSFANTSLIVCNRIRVNVKNLFHSHDE